MAICSMYQQECFTSTANHLMCSSLTLNSLLPVAACWLALCVVLTLQVCIP